jgi:RNA polymerase sigma factor (sigma-70 family)
VITWMGAMAEEAGLAEAIDEADAFAALVADHHADVLRLAGAITGDRDLAADVAQATWAAAWQHRRDLRDPDRVRGWLLTITANQARSALRRRRLRHWLPLLAPAEPSVPARQEERIDLIAALQRLPVRDRQILALRYGLGETSAEIGRRVGLSDAGVRVRISRLLTRLREDLGDE